MVFTDGTQEVCYILNNDIMAKRLKVQYSEDVKTFWISYYRIQTIVESKSQKDVTDEFIQILPKTPIQEQRKSGLGAGAIIAISIMGTVMFFLLLGAMASD